MAHPAPSFLRRTIGTTAAVASLVLAGALAPATGIAAGTAPVIPTDSFYAQQTALQPGATIGAPEAWKVADGHGVVVAVIDSGVDLTHPDLRGALWTNPGEIPGNGIDDDHNGIIDDVHGADFVNGDGNPSDDDGHGTHIAGIIAARADGKGVVGLAPQAQVPEATSQTDVRIHIFRTEVKQRG